MTKIVITLSSTEMRYLREKAAHELRHPNDQARYILRSALLGADLANVDRLSITGSPQGAASAPVLEPLFSP